MSSLIDLATFLLAHADLIELIAEAVTKGVSKDELMKLVKDAMVAASDAEMKRELG